MSAQIIAFRDRRRDHPQETVESARQVREIALDAFRHNDPWHRIAAFEQALKRLPGGRDNLHRYATVFGTDPYQLAVRGL